MRELIQGVRRGPGQSRYVIVGRRTSRASRPSPRARRSTSPQSPGMITKAKAVIEEHPEIRDPDECARARASSPPAPSRPTPQPLFLLRLARARRHAPPPARAARPPPTSCLFVRMGIALARVARAFRSAVHRAAAVLGRARGDWPARVRRHHVRRLHRLEGGQPALRHRLGQHGWDEQEDYTFGENLDKEDKSKVENMAGVAVTSTRASRSSSPSSRARILKNRSKHSAASLGVVRLDYNYRRAGRHRPGATSTTCFTARCPASPSRCARAASSPRRLSPSSRRRSTSSRRRRSAASPATAASTCGSSSSRAGTRRRTRPSSCRRSRSCPR